MALSPRVVCSLLAVKLGLDCTGYTYQVGLPLISKDRRNLLKAQNRNVAVIPTKCNALIEGKLSTNLLVLAKQLDCVIIKITSSDGVLVVHRLVVNQLDVIKRSCILCVPSLSTVTKLVLLGKTYINSDTSTTGTSCQSYTC